MNVICPNCSHTIETHTAAQPEVTLPLPDSRLAETAAGASSLPRAALKPAALHGRYDLLAELGAGGMGVVYKARQTGLNRLVAVKMIRSGALASPAEVQRFQMEAEAAASLRHPNIVAIHEVGEHDGQHFFSMEYVDGPSLAQIVREKPLSQDQAARFVKTIAEAIHYAHESGTLHRDIKPANILIDRDGQPKVSDFGLAKRVEGDSGLTGSGQVLGTPSYMPPEQADPRQGNLGPHSDVYSLGALFYELLTGRPPFRSENPVETLLQVLNTDPVSPRLLNPQLSRDAETVCLKCLEKDPRRRYASARELAEELGRVLANEPIRARPVSTPERVWRWCRRKPVIAGLSAAVIVATLAGVSGIALQWSRAEREWRRAEKNLGEATRNLTEAERQRTLAQQNLALAQEQRERAQTSFEQARQTVDDFLSRVAQDRLLNEPGMHPLRNDLLRLALDYHQQFVAERGDDPAVRSELASSYARVAAITGDIGTAEDAFAAYQKAIALQEQVVRESKSPAFEHRLAEIYRGYADLLREKGRGGEMMPYVQKALAINTRLAKEQAEPEYQRGLASTYRSQAIALLETGQRDEAARYMEKEIQVLEQLAREQADDVQLLVNLGGNLNNLAIAYAQSQRMEEAERAARRAIEHQRKAYERAPKIVQCAEHLSNHYSVLGNIVRALDRPEEAIQAMKQGIEIEERLVRENPSVASFRNGLASALHNLGMAQTDAGHYADAVESLQKARSIRDRLAQDDPGNIAHQHTLGGSWHEIAYALEKQGKLAEAAAAYGHAVEHQQRAHQKSPRVALVREYLANHYQALAKVELARGRLAESVAAASQLRPLMASNPQRLYQSASAIARCVAALDARKDPPADAAQRQMWIDLAVQLLRDAVAGGLKDPGQLRTDPQLSALRDDAGFKQLLENP